MRHGGQRIGAERYWWGRLFVRSATVLAVMLLVATALATLIQMLWLRRALSEAVYQPSAELAEEIVAFTASFRQTADLLVAHVGDSAVSRAPQIAFPTAVNSDADLLRATLALAACEDAIDEMKAGMVARFAEAADWLLDSMDRKAEKIRDRIEQEHVAEAEDLEGRIEALRGQLREGSRGLYGALTPADVRSREQIIDRALDFFDYLADLTQSAAVQSHIDTAVGSLGRMKDMLPEPASESYRLGVVSKVAQLRRRLDSLLKQGQQLEGEQLAERLSQLKSEVIEAVQLSWAVEEDLSRLKSRLEAEAQRAAGAREARLRRLRQGLVRMGLTLGAGMALSFALVVIADVLRALFDTASGMDSLQAAAGASGRERPEQARESRSSTAQNEPHMD